MKIYKIAQQQGQQIDQGEVKTVMEAIQYLNQAVANINRSLEVLERTGTAQLFTRNGIMQAIQGGDLTGLDINSVNEALNAMQQISNSALAINNALRIVKENPEAAQMMKMDINMLSNMMMTALQSGDYSSFQASMSGFQTNLQSMVGTSPL